MEAIVIGGVLLSFYCYKAYCQSQEGISDYKEPGDADTTIPALSQYEEIGNDYMNPLNSSSNMNYMKLKKTEVGPLGIPRIIYEGQGGSWIPTFGWNYNKF